MNTTTHGPDSRTLHAGDAAVEISRLRNALMLSRHEYHELLGAARAAVAAAAQGDCDPLAWITGELAAHGQLPAEGVPPQRVVADTSWAIRTDRSGANAQWSRG